MKKVVVIGAGFGGLTFLSSFKRYAGKKFELILIDKNNYSLFTPMLPEVVSGNVSPENIVFPTREIAVRHRAKFIRDKVIAVDKERNKVMCNNIEVDYDYLVVAAGSQTNFRGNESARKNCFEFKDITDAVSLKYIVIELLESSLLLDKEQRKDVLSFSIIGGGITGVELACELMDFLREKISREYNEIPINDVAVTIFEYANYILPSIDEKQSIKAQEYVVQKGINVITGASVNTVEDGIVNYTQGGESKTYKTNIIIWTAGVKGQDFLTTISNQLTNDGRIKITKSLKPLDMVDGNIFVIGDSSAYEFKGKILPPVAPLAMQQAPFAVKNIIRTERKKPLKSFKYIHFGYLVSLGKNNSVVNLFGIKFRGRFAYFLWKLAYIFRIGMLRKQIGVFFDWIMVTFFGNEATMIMNVENCPGGVLKNINGYIIKIHPENCKKCEHCVVDMSGKIHCSFNG